MSRTTSPVFDKFKHDIRIAVHKAMHAKQDGCCADAADAVIRVLDEYEASPLCAYHDGLATCTDEAEEFCEGCDMRLCDVHTKHDNEGVPLCQKCMDSLIAEQKKSK